MAVLTHAQVGILTPEHPERDERFAARGVEPEVRPSDDLPGWSGPGWLGQGWLGQGCEL